MKYGIGNYKLFIDIEPGKEDIEEILIWLKDEKKRSGVSFYNNKNVIEEAFIEGKAIVFKQGEKNIGIAIWNNFDELKIDINIFVIHPDYRGRGYGRFYYNEIIKFFRSKGFKAIKLFCEPSTSERFWKKMGLIKFPKCGYTEHELTYYMTLIDTASTECMREVDKIELWDVEPYEADEKEAKWIWYVEIKDGVLLRPIIQPCNCNWNIRWSRNNRVIREEKVKYFTNKDYELYCAPFLYIDKLKE